MPPLFPDFFKSQNNFVDTILNQARESQVAKGLKKTDMLVCHNLIIL
jgi:hypothetical protein